MALEKQIVFLNGVNIRYHKISDVKLDNTLKKVEINIKCYTSEEYRLKEKESFSNQKRYEELLNLITTENQKEEIERNTEQVKLWSDEANSLINTFKENIDLSVLTVPMKFEDITDLSLSNIYNLIKQDDMFKDSENI